MTTALSIIDRVATITLANGPVNALDHSVVADLTSALDQIDAADVGAILIESSRARAFCAGADIRFIESSIQSESGIEDMLSFVTALQAVLVRLESHAVPSVVAIDLPATGGGLELALACDIRVVGRTVRVGLPEVNIGLLPGAGGTQRLTRIAGAAATTDLILTGRLITGEEAGRLGIVAHVVDVDDVRPVARELATALASRPPSALAWVKRCIAAADGNSGFELEIEATRDLLHHDATIELVEAFLKGRDKRSAQT
jgi:enoyl-CoA hydratase